MKTQEVKELEGLIVEVQERERHVTRVWRGWLFFLQDGGVVAMVPAGLERKVGGIRYAWVAGRITVEKLHERLKKASPTLVVREEDVG